MDQGFECVVGEPVRRAGRDDDDLARADLYGGVTNGEHAPPYVDDNDFLARVSVETRALPRRRFAENEREMGQPEGVTFEQVLPRYRSATNRRQQREIRDPNYRVRHVEVFPLDQFPVAEAER
jgi:hypothetical protein